MRQLKRQRYAPGRFVLCGFTVIFSILNKNVNLKLLWKFLLLKLKFILFPVSLSTLLFGFFEKSILK